MYLTTLILHSFFRWLVLLSLVYGIFNAYRGWLTHKPLMKQDIILRKSIVILAQIQFGMGVVLYFTSPLTRYFVQNFREAIHNREIRFFGLEHITMMVIAVALITHGSSVANKKKTDSEKFKALALWFSIAMVIIFISIPWPFSPFTVRPYWRF